MRLSFLRTTLITVISLFLSFSLFGKISYLDDELPKENKPINIEGKPSSNPHRSLDISVSGYYSYNTINLEIAPAMRNFSIEVINTSNGKIKTEYVQNPVSVFTIDISDMGRGDYLIYVIFSNNNQCVGTLEL